MEEFGRAVDEHLVTLMLVSMLLSVVALILFLQGCEMGADAKADMLCKAHCGEYWYLEDGFCVCLEPIPGQVSYEG